MYFIFFIHFYILFMLSCSFLILCHICHLIFSYLCFCLSIYLFFVYFFVSMSLYLCACLPFFLLLFYRQFALVFFNTSLTYKHVLSIQEFKISQFQIIQCSIEKSAIMYHSVKLFRFFKVWRDILNFSAESLHRSQGSGRKI